MRISALMENRILYFVIVLVVMGALLGVIRVIRFVRLSDREKTGNRHKLFLFEMIGTVALSLVMVRSCILDPVWLDETILLEEMKPDYWMRLGSSKTKYIDAEIPYVLTEVKKDGFGDITLDDMDFYLKVVSHTYPDAAWAMMKFPDGTGISLPIDTLQGAFYGKINKSGKVDFEKILDFSKPLCEQIPGLTVIRYEYDEDKNPIHEIHLDPSGNPVAVFGDVAEYYRRYDENRHIVWEKRLGIDGSPVLNYLGSAEFERVYDGDHIIREAYFDGWGNPVTITSGYSSVIKGYDDAGNVDHEEYYGSDGNPVFCNGGYASVDFTYDEEKHLTEQRFYGFNGEPVIASAGYASVKRSYEGKDIIAESYFGTDGKPLLMPGGYYSIRQEWDEGILVRREYLDINGNPTVRSDGYSVASWEKSGDTWNVHFTVLSGEETDLTGRNLARDIRYGADGWSEWMMPRQNVTNSTFNIGTVNLGEKKENDLYTCYIEVEFRDVKGTEEQPFGFWTQGAQDGGWTTGNVWNSSLVRLAEVPANGVYTYTCTVPISEAMTHISTFNIGFRCDYWASGSFRVRNVKIEKGDAATGWTPGV